jgi:site-specific DNA-methyltransferase (adenine-specific)
MEEAYDIRQGDCREVMREMPENSVDCCVTSPPYWGLRDYGCEGQMGLEQTPEEYVSKMVEVFREVRRVLREDGTLWMNLGDSYASKQLVGIPWRVAFALQADGWYLRQDIIWHKPNPMPESVRDRCTKAHEYVFLLAKSERYYFDQASVYEVATTDLNHRQTDRGSQGYAMATKAKNGSPQRGNINGYGYIQKGKRNRRSVWTVTTKPFKGAHFAVMPPDLVEPCILAGCPEGGVVLDPFAGSGTVAAVAVRLRRKAIGIDLNPEYIEIARGRIAQSAQQSTTLF